MISSGELATNSSVFVSELGSGGYSDEGCVCAARSVAMVDVLSTVGDEAMVLMVRKGSSVGWGADMSEVMGSDKPALIFWIENGV